MEWINDIIVAECITVGVGDDVTNLGAAAVATYAAIPHCGSYAGVVRQNVASYV